MDILIPLLLVLAMYLLPELFRRRKKTYEYPKIPDSANLAKTKPRLSQRSFKICKRRKPEVRNCGEQLNRKETVLTPVDDLFSQQDLIRGIVFTEILQRPKALAYRKKK